MEGVKGNPETDDITGDHQTEAAQENPTETEDNKRSRKLTEKGLAYQTELLENLFNKRKSAVVKQIEVLHILVTKPEKHDMISAENEFLDKKFEELLEILGRLRDLEITDELKEALSRDIQFVDAEIFNVKMKITHIETIKIDSLNQQGKSSAIPKRELGEEQGQSGVIPRFEGGEIRCQDVYSTCTKKSSSAYSGRSQSSSIKQEAAIVGLQAKREAMIKTHHAEAEYRAIQLEVEALGAKQLKEVEQKLQLLKIDEEIDKAKAMQQVYSQEENATGSNTPASKRSGSSNNSQVSRVSKRSSSTSKRSSSSNDSQVSRVSKRSSIAQKARIAGLEAERIAKLKTQEAEREIEQIKKQNALELDKKLRQAKQNIDLLKLDEQISEAKAIHQLYNDEKISLHIRQDIDKAESSTRNSNQIGDRKVTIGATEKHNKQGHSGIACTSDFNNLAKQLSNIVKLQAAPEVEIDSFSGDPLEFTYFIKNFRDMIESTVDSQTGRLNRLIKYTEGEAKELIKHCVHEHTSECYDKALELLEKEYGNKFKISCAFMEELRTWPVIKQNDAAAMKKFYRFLLKCQTLQRNGELEVLNSPLSIRQIQLKLPSSQQDKWAKIVEQTRRQHGREAIFNDFVLFVDFENSVINDPVYSRCIPSEKKPLHVNTSIIKKTKSDSTLVEEKCVACDSDHNLEQCQIFLNKPIEEKKSLIQGSKLCFACFKPGHISRGCTNRKICSVCGKGHHSSMHIGDKDIKQLATVLTEHGITAMSIIPVMVHHKDDPNKEFKVYAIIDNCSQGTFATNDLIANKLGIVGRKTTLSMQTALAQERICTTAVGGLIVRCTDEHKTNYPDSFEIRLPTVYTRETLPADRSDIATKENALKFDHLKEIAMNLPEFNKNIPIGLLIGQDCPRAIEPYETVHGIGNEPYAVRKVLGWCVMGPLIETHNTIKCNFTKYKIPASNIDTQTPSKHHFSITETLRDTDVSDRLKEMWASDFNETNGEMQAMSMDDKEFLRVMEKNVRHVQGKYELPLPIKNESKLKVSNGLQQAQARIRGIRRRFKNDKKFQEDYSSFMKTLIDKGYARKCEKNSSGLWYIPHHGVYHPSKNKLRVVFDCSARSNGVSLNDVLLQGPDLTNSLVGVLMRFRLEVIAIMGDIEAMFYQVKVPEHQRRYLRFLWWPNSNFNAEPQEYEMCVHLFGANSSPSCANFALRQAASDNEDILGTETANVLRKNFYVDDLLKSYPDAENTIANVLKTQEMCDKGGFNLTKFVSNNKEVVNSIPSCKRAPSMEDFRICEPKLPIERALGVSWCIELDTFEFRIILNDIPLTRRAILSSISSIYDPLGLIAPFLLKGRIFLQEITSEKGCHWDDELKAEHVRAWTDWRTSLLPLQDLKVDRCYKPLDFGESVNTTLHGFSDACHFGYGACCYLRQVNKDGRVHVSLVMGKSRVSPMKYVTMPRLELTASTVAAKLGILIKAELPVIHSISYWIDSQIVLGYINNESRRFRIYVANRTQLIRNLSCKEDWRYVESQENPGDIASRGLTCEDTESVKHWYKGPDFLWLKEEDWRLQQPEFVINEMDPEVQRVKQVNSTSITFEPVLDIIERRISNWNRMKRVMALVLLFIRKCKKQPTTEMQVNDIEEAGKKLIKMAQHKHLSTALKDSHKRSKKMKWLTKLDPFIDSDGLLKVGGRLQNSEQSNQIKFPIILPRKGKISQRLIEWYHGKVQHCGRSTTINEIRSNGYWIIGISSRVKSVIFSCTRCRIFRGRLGEQKMADLPADRLLEVAPFTHCGADMFGPFSIKEGRKVHKRYCVIFTCFSSRAVHLETTNNLDTDSFILALRRFISTRGKVRSIRSDNGGNFVGASNELRNSLKEMDSNKITTFLQGETCDWIEWQKNTPCASHMGGVWERQIRTVRSILTSLLKSHDSVLNDESFNTLIKEVESIINSRPLAIENVGDPDSDLLTPNHLLTLKSKAVLPPPGVFQKEGVYCRRRWRTVQHLTNEFWNQWRKQYLANFHTRQKWTTEKRNLEIGDIVLLKEENVPRNSWPVARITKTFPNDDGLVRSVEIVVSSKLQTKLKTLKRPISKLVMICEASNDNDKKECTF